MSSELRRAPTPGELDRPDRSAPASRAASSASPSTATAQPDQLGRTDQPKRPDRPDQPDQSAPASHATSNGSPSTAKTRSDQRETPAEPDRPHPHPPLRRRLRLPGRHHLSTLTVLTQTWRSDRPALLQLLACIGLGGLAPAVQVHLMAGLGPVLFHAASTGRPRIRSVLLYLAAMGAVALLSDLVSAVKRRATARAQSALSASLSIRIIRRALSLSLPEVEDAAVQDAIQRAVREVTFRPGMLLEQAVQLCSQALAFVTVSAVLLSVDWRVAALAVLAPLPSVAVQLVQGRQGHRLEHQRSADRRRVVYWQVLASQAVSLKEIHAFRLGRLLTSRHEELAQRIVREDTALADRNLRMSSAAMVATGLISFGAEACAVLTGMSGAGVAVLLAVLQAITLLQNSTLQLLAAASGMYVNQLYLVNVLDFIGSPGTRPAAATGAAEGDAELPERLTTGVEFRDVTFVYPGATRPALDRASFTLRPGETTAIVGLNGAGKSTIAKLIDRLYEPTEGTVLIDGRPVTDYRLDSLRHRISFVFQDFVTYQHTIAENIGFGTVDDPEAFTSIPESLAERVGLADLVESLPAGYQTHAGKYFDGGVEFSGGQWQRLAIARGLAAPAVIRVLDEPTAALDPLAEAALLDELTAVRPGFVTVMIAHRFSSILRADHIIVLDRGRVAEEGTHAELVARRGLYAQMYEVHAQSVA